MGMRREAREALADRLGEDARLACGIAQCEKLFSLWQTRHFHIAGSGREGRERVGLGCE